MKKTKEIDRIIRIASKLRDKYTKEHYKVQPKPSFTIDPKGIKPDDPTNLMIKLEVISDVMDVYMRDKFKHLLKNEKKSNSKTI